MRIRFAAAAMIVAVISPNASQAADSVTFAVPGLTFPDLALHYGVSAGFFAAQGIDAKIVLSQRRDLATLAVISGDAIGSITDPIETAIASERGAQIKAVAALAANAPPSIIGIKSITEDQKTWKGKTLSVFPPPNTPYTLFMRELKLGGWKEVSKHVYRLDPNDSEKDFLRLSIGMRGTEIAAILAGRSHFAVLHEPDASTAIIRANMHVVKRFAGSFDELLWSTLNVSQKTIDEKPALLQRLIAGFNATLRDIHSNPEKAIKGAMKLFPEADPKVIEAAVRNLTKMGVYPKNCMFSAVGWKTNLDLFKLTDPDSSAVNVPFEKITDLSFCKKAIESRGG